MLSSYHRRGNQDNKEPQSEHVIKNRCQLCLPLEPATPWEEQSHSGPTKDRTRSYKSKPLTSQAMFAFGMTDQGSSWLQGMSLDIVFGALESRPRG